MVIAPIRVGRVANICVTHLGMMHLILTCEVHHPELSPFLDSLRMETIACCLVSSLCIFRWWFR
jgi:hypothetical protein